MKMTCPDVASLSQLALMAAPRPLEPSRRRPRCRGHWGQLIAISSLVVAASAQPLNDNFSVATILSPFSTTLAGTTVNATSEANERTHERLLGNGPRQSVWWQFEPPQDGAVSLRGQWSGGSFAMAAYEGRSLAGLIQLG